jgi:ABC-type antimicrobial peptide transport system permease subunit
MTLRKKSRLVLAAALAALLTFSYAVASYYFFPLDSQTQSGQSGNPYNPANNSGQFSPQISWTFFTLSLAMLLIIGIIAIIIVSVRAKKHTSF